MRLWHQSLIPHLPNKQLGGQWVEIRMILGTIAKHGKVNHSTVNYVNDHHICFLYAYAYLVANECIKRGRYCNPDFIDEYSISSSISDFSLKNGINIYPEHDEKYLEECLLNLEGKGIYLREKLNSVGSQVVRPDTANVLSSFRI